MAMRKVYFFKVCLFESSGKEISYTGLKDKLSEIIENKGVNQGGILDIRFNR